MKYYRLTVYDEGTAVLVEVSGEREVFGQPGAELTFASIADAVLSLAPVVSPVTVQIDPA